MTMDSSSKDGWAGGWGISAVAGVIAAILARWLGDSGMAATVLTGFVVFLVFGVLLGMFWGQPAWPGGHHDHGHDDHAHDDHGHDTNWHVDHGHGDHGQATAVISVSEVLPVAAPVVAPVELPHSAIHVAPVVTAVPVVEAARESVASPVALVVPMAEIGTAVVAKPAGLAGPRDGKGDALQIIEGIGPVLEKLCHELGIFHFDQIAAWSAGEIAWMDGNLKGFKGRATRDKWVRQANLIREVGLDEFRRRASTNDY